MALLLDKDESVIMQGKGKVKGAGDSQNAINQGQSGTLTLTSKRLILEWKGGGLLSKKDQDWMMYNHTEIRRLELKGLIGKRIEIHFLGKGEYEFHVSDPEEWARKIGELWGISGRTTKST